MPVYTQLINADGSEVAINTTIPIHKALLTHSDFRAGEHDTGFVERYFSNHSPRIKS